MVYAETGLTHSEHLKKQKEEEGGSTFGGGLRYPNAILFWITCDQVVAVILYEFFFIVFTFMK